MAGWPGAPHDPRRTSSVPYRDVVNRTLAGAAPNRLRLPAPEGDFACRFAGPVGIWPARWGRSPEISRFRPGSNALPLNIDDIRKGRRRSWEKLTDPEERKRREREEREKDPEFQKRKSRLKRQEDEREEARRLDHEKWLRTKKQLIVAGTVFVIFMVALTTAKVLYARHLEAARQNKLDRLEQMVATGDRVVAFDDPIEALESWRSAWARLSAPDVYHASSTRRQIAHRGRQDEGLYLVRQQKLMFQGALETERELALAFEDPQILRWPSSEPRHGELAVFVSKPFSRPQVRESPEEWVAAFSWDKVLKQWRHEEHRKRRYWIDAWRNNASILPVHMISRQ